MSRVAGVAGVKMAGQEHIDTSRWERFGRARPTRPLLRRVERVMSNQDAHRAWRRRDNRFLYAPKRPGVHLPALQGRRTRGIDPDHPDRIVRQRWREVRRDVPRVGAERIHEASEEV